MEKIMTDKVAERVTASRERITSLYRHKPDDRVLFWVNDMTYRLNGRIRKGE